ncbi:MAG: hypothetical protein JNL11_09010 [Bdellovibrionaceae bacterium]|nr:hypothetical protein [Pseudobdellovibrionaceae bacterium]
MNVSESAHFIIHDLQRLYFLASIREAKVFYEDEPEGLPWDYFLTNYERDLLTLTIEELTHKNPDKNADENRADMGKKRASQGTFDGNP